MELNHRPVSTIPSVRQRGMGATIGSLGTAVLAVLVLLAKVERETIGDRNTKTPKP